MRTLDKSKRSSATVRRAVLATLGAAGVGTCLPFATAHAQEELQEVVVTGSILRRADLETPSPMTILTAETLDERGINTVTEAVQRLSANNAGTMTSNWSSWGFASGASAPALRGLTVQATLSIADGLRLAPYPLADDGQRNFVDLGSIPDAIIERVEILRDGASSTYGADAIAGVVNIITKKEIQGFEIGGSYGDSEEGGGAETRVDVTWGTGDLASDGYNFYLSAEYQQNKDLWASDRGYPFNTADLQRTCGASGSCLPNHNWNGVTAEDGFFNGPVSVPGITMVRPVDDALNIGVGRYEYLNQSLGCGDFPSVTIDPAQSATSPLTACEVDYRGEFLMLEPDIERIGAAMRFTTNVGENAQFYAMANIYKIDTFSQITPLGFNGLPTPPRPATLASYNVLLPVYVCTTGVGTFDGLNTGCDATNGTLNPYNPYAAQGQRAQAFLRNPFGRAGDLNTTNTRLALGLDGGFGDGWTYTASFSASEVDQEYTQTNYMIPQKIMDVVAQGTFNFNDVMATDQAVWDYLQPPSVRENTSELWQIQGTIGKDLFDLPGGALQAAVGLAFRDESITAPSANPANDSAPYERYYSLNAVGTSGSRDVESAFFEVSAPIVNSFELLASGRYDSYSSGQDNFSPKVGFKFQPIDMVTLRGTYSEGFRVPSFSEAYGLPTTGYVSRTIDCAAYADFCNDHGGDAQPYVVAPYNLGLTQTGDPELDPEESTSYTVGLIFQPMSNLTFTVDWWHIEVENLIVGVVDTSEAEDQYYSNNGVVNIPGITVVPGVPDPNFPNALPLLGFIQTAYTNQDEQIVQGIDFGATTNFQFGAVNWISSLEMSYLERFELRTDSGRILDYEDTLSPCNITSCSGAPEWRGNWQNTFQFSDTSVSLTAYYTKGYATNSIDFGAPPKNCQNGIGASVTPFIDGTPFNCRTDDQWNVDLTVRHQLNDQLTMFVDVMNVLDIEAEFDPSAAYALYNYNPSWAGPNAMGRFFRLGAKYKF